MKLGVVMSGNSASSRAYGLVEVEIASRRGAEKLEGCRVAELYVAASTRRLPFRSTSKEFERRKSAPNRGRDTSATTKSHRYVLDAKCRESVRVPYVRIELPLAASSRDPSCLVHLSSPNLRW